MLEATQHIHYIVYDTSGICFVSCCGGGAGFILGFFFFFFNLEQDVAPW